MKIMHIYIHTQRLQNNSKQVPKKLADGDLAKQYVCIGVKSKIQAVQLDSFLPRC